MNVPESAGVDFRVLGFNYGKIDTPDKEALFALFTDEISERPKFFYQNFIDAMSRKGTPVNIANKAL